MFAAGFYNYGDEPLGFREFLDQLNNYELLNKEPVTGNVFVFFISDGQFYIIYEPIWS